MFVIPMVGKSSRFFDAGYEVPKFQLECAKESVFDRAVKSFNKYFSTDYFIFVVPSAFDAESYVVNSARRLGIQNFHVIVLEDGTSGQGETVYSAFKNTAEFDDEPLFIFNIDTFLLNFTKPEFHKFCDGYLEVFSGEGDHWSFVKPAEGNSVLRTSEKVRISELCSNGLYYFRSAGLYKSVYKSSVAKVIETSKESYIAPMYNFLIENGGDVRYKLVDGKDIVFCGTPEEYMNAIHYFS